MEQIEKILRLKKILAAGIFDPALAGRALILLKLAAIS